MRWAFWLAAFVIGYAYFGYPALLYLQSRWWSKPVKRGSGLPTVSIVMAVHNEESVLAAKLENLAALDYPAGQIESVVVSDGSTDGTARILGDWAGERRLAVVLAENGGKALALNRGLEAACGEIVVFTDARQAIARDAVRCMVESFADPGVGCVSGELILSEGEATTGGLGLYWEMEKKIRQWESATGSVVGATGALYAARREIVPVLPAGTILDDVYVPLHAAGRGRRVLFDGRALSYDRLADHRREFWRKVRTLGGNYQLVQLAPWLLGSRNPIRFRFVSHKLLRLLVPFALLAILISSVFVSEPLYRLALAGELAVCVGAALGSLRIRLGVVSKVGRACAAFLVLNAAAAVAFAYFVTGRRIAWTR